MRRWILLTAAAAAPLVSAAIAGCGGDESATGRIDTSAPFDQAFIDAMVPHHESAIEMAKEAVAAGLSEPELLLVTDSILATQQQEIDQMKEWRAAWFGSSTIDPDGAEALGMSMEEMGMTHSSGSFADEDDLGPAFAAAMTMHHEGAIAMAKLALDRAEHPELRTLAQAIIDAQAGEIETMKKYAARAEGHEGMDGM